MTTRPVRLQPKHRDTQLSVLVTDLVRRFGSTEALRAIDLRIEGPGIVSLLGPNGCGKTTLIRCILGLLHPTSGTVLVNGRAPSALHQLGGARVGYMPQETALYADLTVEQNIAFFATLHGVAREFRDTAVMRALEITALLDRVDARIGTLSGGMRRRASLACALVHNPDLAFLDEPTVGVDPELRAAMWAEFRSRRDRGTLLLISTHDMHEAHKSDRVVLMRRGRLLGDGPPRELMRATGSADLEAAFLAYIRRARA